MRKYPRTLPEFEADFATEAACREYLFRLRWPEGFRCPHCGHSTAWRIGEVLWQCPKCHNRTSLTAGTVFENTRKPLALWFRAMWLVTSQKNGVSALGLQKVLGLGSYETAWTWLHKLRRAMVRPGRDRLSGVIEVDETYWGGPEEGVRGRETFKKVLIVVAAQEDGKAVGRIRLRHVADASSASLLPFIEDSIEPGSLVKTDGWKGYNGLGDKGYRRQIIVVSQRRESASDLLPGVHRVVSLLKRWLMGTHQGAVSSEHLDYYLDEFTFRFNRRTSRHRGMLFYRLAQQAVALETVLYKDMVTHCRGPKPQGYKM